MTFEEHECGLLMRFPNNDVMKHHHQFTEVLVWCKERGICAEVRAVGGVPATIIHLKGNDGAMMELLLRWR